MIKKGKRLATILLTVAMVITFIPVLSTITGGKTGVQTVHAMSVYAPSINLERNSIILHVDNPYAGTRPGCIESWEKVLDEATGTKITIMDMWIDAENGPMNEESKFVEGKKYTYQAYVASVTDSGTAPDLSTWGFDVIKVFSDLKIDWPDGTVTCDKTKDKILYTAQFIAKAVPSRDKGTYTLNISNGKVRVSDEAAKTSLDAITYDYPSRSSESEYDYDVDLDKDGTYDIGVLYGAEIEYIDCGKLTTTKIKNQITVKVSDAAKRHFDINDFDYYGALTIKFDKLTNPLTIKPKTATIKYSKLKKKTQTLAVTKVIKFTKDAKDKKTYTLVSTKKGSKSFKKYFKINKTTGKVTVKKGLKKGTYKVKVKVKAAGNSNYKPSAVKAVTFTVRVK